MSLFSSVWLLLSETRQKVLGEFLVGRWEGKVGVFLIKKFPHWPGVQALKVILDKEIIKMPKRNVKQITKK